MVKEDDSGTSAKFVTFEGVDKTGKTLICNILETEYPEYTYIYDPPKFEPWDSIFTDGTKYGKNIPNISESFLLLSARLHNYTKEISKSLRKGKSVIADRYADSWFAYQSIHTEKYFQKGACPLDFFKKIHESCVNYGLLKDPDVTILIIADRKIIEKRLKRTKNRTEYEDIEFLIKVQGIYKQLATEYTKRYRIVEDKDQGIINVYNEIKKILKKEGICK